MLGVVKFVDELLSIINDVKIVEIGFVYFVDGLGIIIVYFDILLLGSVYLLLISGSNVVNCLLVECEFVMVSNENDDGSMFYVSIYVDKVGWYVVV